jgi:hypothetical protein
LIVSYTQEFKHSVNIGAKLVLHSSQRNKHGSTASLMAGCLYRQGAALLEIDSVRGEVGSSVNVNIFLTASIIRMHSVIMMCRFIIKQRKIQPHLHSSTNDSVSEPFKLSRSD